MGLGPADAAGVRHEVFSWSCCCGQASGNWRINIVDIQRMNHEALNAELTVTVIETVPKVEDWYGS
jgi:hypothetical protein